MALITSDCVVQRDIKKDLELREKRNEELTGQVIGGRCHWW